MNWLLIHDCWIRNLCPTVTYITFPIPTGPDDFFCLPSSPPRVHPRAPNPRRRELPVLLCVHAYLNRIDFRFPNRYCRKIELLKKSKKKLILNIKISFMSGTNEKKTFWLINSKASGNTLRDGRQGSSNPRDDFYFSFEVHESYRYFITRDKHRGYVYLSFKCKFFYVLKYVTSLLFEEFDGPGTEMYRLRDRHDKCILNLPFRVYSYIITS